MPGIFGNNVQKCSPLEHNSGTGVLPILVLIFVLAQYRGLVLEYCFFWCYAVLILVLKLGVLQIEIGKVHVHTRVSITYYESYGNLDMRSY